MIEIEEHSPEWFDVYENEKSIILAHCGNWIEGIEHIGSTAIIFLPAKPTIDICIGVKNLKIADDSIIKALIKLGYEYIKEYEGDMPDRRYLQKINSLGNHLVHIHIVEFEGNRWNEYLKFRDYLMSHPEEAKRYAELKIILKDKFSSNRKAYTEGKNAFIQNILVKTRNQRKQA